MFVIFEGCDGSGKSSLAAAVAEEVRKRHPEDTVQEIHRSQLKRPPLDEYVFDVSDYEPDIPIHIVADRWHWGEEVYGPLYRGKSASTLGQFRWMDMWLSSRGATTWHVTQPIERIVDRLNARGEDFLRGEHIMTVLQVFDDIAKQAATSTDSVEPEGDTSVLVQRIVNRAEYQAQSSANTRKYASYVGDPMPHTILVGEKRGGEPPYVTESAFMPINGNSGEYLLSSLPADWWRGVALVNGVEEGDKLTQLVEDTAGPQVVALGRAASDVLMDLDIEHGGVPHPQYVRRFHNSKQSDYGILIREHARTGDIKFSWPS